MRLREEAARSHHEGASSAPAAEKGSTLDLYLTSYQLSMGLRELRGAGELYQDVVEVARPMKSGLNHFQSLWGESLKKGDLSDWKQSCLKTQYQIDNERAQQRLQESEVQKNGRDRFLEYVHANRMYYGDLFTDEAVDKLGRWYEEAPAEDRERFLGLMRDLHASIQPDKGYYMSHTHATHRRLAPFGNQDVDKLVAKLSKILVYGFPRKVELRPFSAPVKPRELSQQQDKRRGPKPVWSPPTFESNFSLKQPEAAAYQPNSRYKWVAFCPLLRSLCAQPAAFLLMSAGRRSSASHGACGYSSSWQPVVRTR